MVGAATSISISVTSRDLRDLERLMAEHGVERRSDMFRMLLRGGQDGLHDDCAGLLRREPAIDGTAVAAAVRERLAGLAGVPYVTGADWPDIGLTGYELALVVGRSHMRSILAGTIPVEYDDAVTAGLDPHGKQAYELYVVSLPRLFGVLLDRSPPLLDVRYDPLDSVNGEYWGVVRGEVTKRDIIYPNGGTKQYHRITIRAPHMVVPVLLPADWSAEGVEVGCTATAAGVFVTSRQRIGMHARTCGRVDVEGYDSLYELVSEWGLPPGAADGVIRMLLDRHGGDAARFAEWFARFARMDGETDPMDLTIRGAGGRVLLRQEDLRALPGGAGGLAECVEKWPRVTRRAVAAGVSPAKQPHQGGAGADG